MSETPNKPLKIDGLITKPEPLMEELGTFKLKDHVGRNAVQIDLSKATRPLTDAQYLFVVKMHGENNKVKVVIQWKPKMAKVEIPDEITKDKKDEDTSK